MNYTKDFLAWSEVKHTLQSRAASAPRYREREVWWAALGLNIGDEEDGKNTNYTRPVLIIKGFSENLFWALPLSTTSKKGRYYHSTFVGNKSGAILMSQLRTMDRKRLIRRIGLINRLDFEKIRKILRGYLL